ncbi:MAG: hypothetical protein AB7O91_12395 [Sphingomonas sp.]
MKKPLVLAAFSGLILIGAAYPDGDRLGYDHRGYASADNDAPRTYRPCRSRRDDNCIQLYERGVRAAYARWLRDGDPGYEEAVRYASLDGRRYGRHGRHDHGRDDLRRTHRNHFARDGHHGRDDMHRGHHARDGHRAHGAQLADGGDHAGRGGRRTAMLDMRCDHRAAPPRARAPRAPLVRPQPRSHNHEDSGVRGM